MPGRPDLSTLAAKLGLSPTTVSRVLSGQAERYRISEATRKRVLGEAERSGLVINQVARGLRLQKSLTIGLALPDISNPFFAALARQIEHGARSRGFAVFLADSAEDTEREAECLRALLGRRVDGMIVAPVGGDTDALLALESSSLPTVVIDRIVPGLPFPMVGNDNFKAAHDAVTLLAKAGHQRIACLRGLPAAFSDQERVRGYREGMRDAGLGTRDEWIRGDDFRAESAAAATRTLMALVPDLRPTAAVPLGSQITLGLLESLRDLGLQIPEDLSIVAFDEQPWSGLVDPPLTTVAQPLREMADRAADLLFAQIEAPAKHHPEPALHMLQSELIVRKSVRDLRD